MFLVSESSETSGTNVVFLLYLEKYITSKNSLMKALMVICKRNQVHFKLKYCLMTMMHNISGTHSLTNFPSLVILKNWYIKGQSMEVKYPLIPIINGTCFK